MALWLTDQQKMGVVFCSGGMLLKPVILLAQVFEAGGIAVELLASNMGCFAGCIFLVLGVILFFDRAMLAMGNVLFLVGLTIIVGPAKTMLFFFARRQKLKGSAAFFSGLVLILMRWPLVGFLIEVYGIAVLFGDFVGTILSFARSLPVVGPYVVVVSDKLTRFGVGVGQRNAEMAV